MIAALGIRMPAQSTQHVCTERWQYTACCYTPYGCTLLTARRASMLTDARKLQQLCVFNWLCALLLVGQAVSALGAVDAENEAAGAGNSAHCNNWCYISVSRSVPPVLKVQ